MCYGHPWGWLFGGSNNFEAWHIRGPHLYHDDVIKWKHFPRYWPFVRGIHRSPVIWDAFAPHYDVTAMTMRERQCRAGFVEHISKVRMKFDLSSPRYLMWSLKKNHFMVIMVITLSSLPASNIDMLITSTGVSQWRPYKMVMATLLLVKGVHHIFPLQCRHN